MAGLTRGLTINTDTIVTSQTLHNLIDNALISGIGVSDLQAGSHFVFVGTSTPNPSHFPFWYSTDYDDPVFRVFAKPWDIWLTVGPDRFEMPMLNTAATMVAMGSLVVGCNPSNFGLATNCSINALGFLQATTASGAYGPVCPYGIGWVLHISSASALTLGIGDNGTPTATSGLKTFGCPAGGVYAQGLGGNGGSDAMFGVFLEGNRSGASGSYSRFRALIWGPKVVATFP